MNDDLISRQAAIDLAKDLCVPTKDGSTYRHRCIDPDTIRELPSAQRWIPVSERLPGDEGWYLVTDDSGGVRWLEVEYYDPESGLKPFCTIQNPVAWMPLPEPWKGEDDAEVH